MKVYREHYTVGLLLHCAYDSESTSVTNSLTVIRGLFVRKDTVTGTTGCLSLYSSLFTITVVQ